MIVVLVEAIVQFYVRCGLILKVVDGPLHGGANEEMMHNMGLYMAKEE